MEHDDSDEVKNNKYSANYSELRTPGLWDTFNMKTTPSYARQVFGTLLTCKRSDNMMHSANRGRPEFPSDLIRVSVEF